MLLAIFEGSTHFERDLNMYVKEHTGPTGQLRPAIPELERLRQRDCWELEAAQKFQARLDYILRLCL